MKHKYSQFYVHTYILANTHTHTHTVHTHIHTYRHIRTHIQTYTKTIHVENLKRTLLLSGIGRLHHPWMFCWNCCSNIDSFWKKKYIGKIENNKIVLHVRRSQYKVIKIWIYRVSRFQLCNFKRVLRTHYLRFFECINGFIKLLASYPLNLERTKTFIYSRC